MASSTETAESIKIPQLPPDLIASILALLPAKSLHQMISVCKSWNHMIRKDRFFITHHINTRNNSNKPNIASLSCSFSFRGNYVLSYGHGSEFHKVYTFFSEEPHFMTSSCDGLVGIYSRDRFLLVNPSINKVAELPRGTPHSCPLRYPVAGIGYEACTGDYKVVRIFHRGYESVGCEMFSLKNGTWKSIEDPPAPLYQIGLPFVVNGFMYWTVQYYILKYGVQKHVLRPEIGVRLNLREEKFSVVLHPMGGERSMMSKLVCLGGYACVVDTRGNVKGVGRMTIWRLMNESKSEWVKQYEIDLPKIEIPGRKIPHCVSLIPLTIDDGRIVLYGDHGWRQYYDPVTRRFFKYETIDNIEREHATPCVESVVSFF